MHAPRKRQKVSSACQRCRARKLGCDSDRPCQLCTRAGVECVPRHVGTTGVVSSVERSVEPSRNHQADDQPDVVGTAVLPESSIVDLSTTMFLGKVSHQDTPCDTSALPGGNKLSNHASAGPWRWRNLVGVDLPTDEVLEEIVESFFLSVDWFMMVFHKDSFKRRYEELLHRQHLSHHDVNFLWTCMLVIALGAHYSALTPFANQHTVNYRRLSEDLLAKIEARFLEIVGCSTLETVQICVLLGSFFLFNGRPNAGVGISASGVKIAQVIGLHRESLWKETSQAEREEKRRTWWALEVFDKYAAIAFGRPCIIDDSDCNVSMISHVKLAEQVDEENPLLLYHQCKFRLYRIMGAFLGRRRQLRRLETVQTIHQQLLQWRVELPDLLRLEKCYNDSEQISLLQMQALNLQLTYDNLQIILHRTAAFRYDNKDGTPRTANTGSSTSLQQLLDSAMDTSELYRYSNILHASRRTHADMHIGITLFTAGVVLCAICLSHPMTDVGSRAKTGVMHIIRMCRNASSSNQHLVSIQSLRILDKLVTVVLQLETDLITGRIDHPAVVNPDRPKAIMPIHNTMSAIETAMHGADSENAEHSVLSSSSKRLLHPIQEVFANHISQSTRLPSTPLNTSAQIEAAEETSGPPVVDEASTFDWDGDLSFLVDSGLSDASQLWLWADNLNFDSFDGHHN